MNSTKRQVSINEYDQVIEDLSDAIESGQTEWTKQEVRTLAPWYKGRVDRFNPSQELYLERNEPEKYQLEAKPPTQIKK